MRQRLGAGKAEGSLSCNDHEMLILSKTTRRSCTISMKWKNVEMGKYEPAAEWGRGASDADTEKAEVTVSLLPQSFFTSTINLQGPEKMVKDSSKEQHREGLLSKWVTPDTMTPDGMHPRVPREVGDVIVRPLSVFKRLGWLRNVPDAWRNANITPTLNRSWTEGRSASPQSLGR